ncbi:hypothetical protein E4T80_09725 [Muribacter muris]|uniref:Uncharacterized protein n=1 Tax=Muribacter muris TaxID=67855 RepID=A0A4Y9JUI8_9PAST|nr:hypothetical protein [Muribacter muris]MBF0785736.1 hypothetical protein [Muribacter muris]MBF0828292.1 hypothetical protein [Muribacter muris]TFV08559.1 hypothetical protein E4T80_09725 [Muribacter muris]
MWDSFSKIVIHLIDKVSLTAMFLFTLTFGLLWFAIPYEMAAYYLAPRILPMGIYWGFLFVCSSGVFLFCRVIENYCYPRFKRWKAFRAWEKIYATLSPEELAIVEKLVSQDGAPLELKNAQAINLVSKGIISVKLFHPMFNSYLLTASFRAFIFNKYRTEIHKKPTC